MSEQRPDYEAKSSEETRDQRTLQQVRTRIEHALSEHKEATNGIYDLFERIGITKGYLREYSLLWEEITKHLSFAEADITNALRKLTK